MLLLLQDIDIYYDTNYIKLINDPVDEMHPGKLSNLSGTAMNVLFVCKIRRKILF